MSEVIAQQANPRKGDREYLWFALVLIVVLTSSVQRPPSPQPTSSTLESTASNR